jgi:hypothetical protein
MLPDSDGDDPDPLFATPTSSVVPSSLRMRVFGTVLGVGGSSKTRSQNGLKSISTTPGMRGAGETETEAEADEPVSALYSYFSSRKFLDRLNFAPYNSHDNYPPLAFSHLPHQSSLLHLSTLFLSFADC